MPSAVDFSCQRVLGQKQKNVAGGVLDKLAQGYSHKHKQTHTHMRNPGGCLRANYPFNL